MYINLSSKMQCFQEKKGGQTKANHPTTIYLGNTGSSSPQHAKHFLCHFEHFFLFDFSTLKK